MKTHSLNKKNDVFVTVSSWVETPSLPTFSEGTPLSRYPLFLKQILKITPLFLKCIQIGACKLYETL